MFNPPLGVVRDSIIISPRFTSLWQVSPGAMQDLIHHGGSVGDTISVKKVIHNFHQQPLKFKNVSSGLLTAVFERLS
jgi:hypothetical protein